MKGLKCIVKHAEGVPCVIHGVRSARLPELTSVVGEAGAAFAARTGFTAKPGEVAVVPVDGGVAALLGLPAEGKADPFVFGGLARALPAGEWRYSLPADVDHGTAVLGFALGAYRFSLKQDEAAPAAVLCEESPDALAVEMARSVWLGRDLINLPANLLGPSELAEKAADALEPFGAKIKTVKGAALDKAYPLLAHVGNGSDRKPRVLVASWAGSGADKDAPLLSLVGKGVCFDSGGYDIKPASGMLRMKKDMGGAASVLALARLIMARDVPVRLEVRLGCVENSVSGSAMRPLDVVTARNGLTVEIGNTDAEGRLVMADLLTEASSKKPDLLLDIATLTGAARVALGPDLPGLLCNDDGVASSLLEAGSAVSDPFWRLPLWDGYREWLRSSVADLNNISSKPFAGAVTAALFLEHFVGAGVRWAHIDSYAWNDHTRPGRPEGGEILGVRGIFEALPAIFNLKDLLNSR